MAVLPDSTRIELAVGVIRVLIKQVDYNMARMEVLLKQLDCPKEEIERAAIAIYGLTNKCRELCNVIESGEEP